MKKGESGSSHGRSYQEIGDYWDAHDLGEVWDETEPAAFTVDTGSSATYYPVERELSARLQALARERGISATTLLNLWLQERAGKETTASS